MHIQEISQDIEKFLKARNWRNTNPSQLMNAITTEVGELGEHFLWKNEFPELDSNKRTEIAYELVDILVYLLQISSRCGIEDLGEYYQAKIKKLADKYPENENDHESWKQRHEEYKQTGRNKLYK